MTIKKPNQFDVILEKVGNQPLMTTKILREELGFGLSAAKDMVDNAPVTLASGLDSTKALDLKKKLDALGNTVSVPGLKIEETSSAPGRKVTNLDVDEAFDAIFGAGSAQKATPLVVINNTAKVVAKTETKTTAKRHTAADNDDFDALFGNRT